MANTLTLVITTAVMLLFISDSYGQNAPEDPNVPVDPPRMNAPVDPNVPVDPPRMNAPVDPNAPIDPPEPAGIECFENHPWDYDGKEHTTQNGVECQRWDANWKPRFVSWIYRHLPENYCRSVMGSNYDPWCYTTSGPESWDYCHVRKCGAKPRPKQEKDCFVGVPSDYDGTRSTTWRGETCQEWSTNSPQTIYHKYSHFPKNYCRTLKGEEHYKPWCYIADTNSVQHWGYCGVDECAKE